MSFLVYVRGGITLHLQQSEIYSGFWFLFKKFKKGPGVVAQACNPSPLGGQGRGIPGGQEFEPSLEKMVST
ncbi:hypothetical protein KGV55_03650, partial [Candidatus Gracilibacteria bacterium]|nr:hypothetical protein [Candidatus Gracilibacteria bacterium]